MFVKTLFSSLFFFFLIVALYVIQLWFVSYSSFFRRHSFFPPEHLERRLHDFGSSKFVALALLPLPYEFFKNNFMLSELSWVCLFLPLCCIHPLLCHYVICAFGGEYILRDFSSLQCFVLEGSFGWAVWSAGRIYCPSSYRPYQSLPSTHLLIVENKKILQGLAVFLKGVCTAL